MPVTDCFVSVVVPLRDDASIIDGFIADVMTVLRRNFGNYELVLVDDGSEDDTVERVVALLDQYECIRILRLSRSFGEEVAITAGLDSVIGDFTVIMLPNSDPPELIPEFVERARRGTGVVFGVRRSRPGEGILTRIGAAVWYGYSRRFLDLNLPRNSSQFRTLSRQAVNAVVRIRDKYRYLRVLSADVGFAATGIEYDPVIRNPAKQQRGFWERTGVSIDIVVANSRHPLRVVTALGVIASVVNLLYVCYVVAIYLFRGHVAEGWTTLSLQNAAMFFFVFMILTVMSEYVGHILVESRDRPLYYVSGERNSSAAIADRNRRNIVTESVNEGL
jgi:dolichol-phosphate mannosyltransferase